MTGMDGFVRQLPKAELHVHIEGTLEPELVFELAARNGVALPYADVAALRRAYVFDDLQSFLDIYYANCAVLRTEQDFYDLTMAYLTKASSQGVRHAEIFFDPQTHTERGVSFETCCTGIRRALDDGAADARDLVGPDPVLPPRPERGGGAARRSRRPGRSRTHLIGVGLDSAEVGNPPSKFAEAFRRAREMGLPGVAHAGRGGSAGVHLGGARRARRRGASTTACAAWRTSGWCERLVGGADPAHRVPVLQRQAARLPVPRSSTTCRPWCGAASW